MSEWQDISTAPRDGTEILAYMKIENNHFFSLMLFKNGGWRNFAWDYSEDKILGWMPLPNPPTKKHLCKAYDLNALDMAKCESDETGQLHFKYKSFDLFVLYCPFCGKDN